MIQEKTTLAVPGYYTELRPITQLAFSCRDVNARVASMRALGATNWVVDETEGEHIFLPTDLNDIRFGVTLAFNYDLMESRLGSPVQVEFIQRKFGVSVNLQGSTPAHMGYQVKNLVEEVKRMAVLGFRLEQVSQTVQHSGDHDDTYRYAYWTWPGMGTFLKAYEKIIDGQKKSLSSLQVSKDAFGVVLDDQGRIRE